MSQTRPRLLDGCCCAGGATRGYQQAGFWVKGADIEDQPNYCGDEFERADIVPFIREHGREFEAIHVSPVCKGYSGMTNCRPGRAGEHPRLIDAVRYELQQTGRPWVIENVEGSGLLRQDTLDGGFGVELCGAMFGLPLYRHRLFETSFPIVAPPHPRHLTPASKAGHWEPGTVISVAGHVNNTDAARAAMGIGWTTRDELVEAIPPVMTRWIGEQLLAHIESRVA